MSNAKDGGPAFPVPMGADWPECDRGMSLRDYLAAKAMAATLSDAVNVHCVGELAKERNADPCDVIAAAAYDYADAMLRARSGGQS